MVPKFLQSHPPTYRRFLAADTLGRIASVTSSLGAKRVGDQAFKLSQQQPIRSLLVEPACCGDAATLEQIHQWRQTA